MKRITIVLNAVLFPVFALMACTNPASDPTPASEPTPAPELEPVQSSIDSVTYTNSEYGFSLEYPKDWDITEDYLGCVFVIHEPYISEDYMVNISLLTENLAARDTEVTFNEFWRGVEFVTQRDNPSYKEIEKYDRIISGEPAKVIVFTVHLEFDGVRTDLKDIYAMFTRDDIGYILTYDVPTEFHDKYYDCFQLVLDTFKFD